MPHERHLADADYRTAACCVHTVQCQICLEAFLSVVRMAAWWTGRAAGSCQRGSFKVTTAPPPPDFPLTAEEWVRQAAEAGESAKGLASALQAYLDDAQRSGSNVVRHNLHRMLLLAPAIAAAQRSRDWAGVQRLSQEFRAEVEQHAVLTGCTAYFRDRTFQEVLDSLQLRCSGCGAVAVGLR